LGAAKWPNSDEAFKIGVTELLIIALKAKQESTEVIADAC
jgi:hypothetical protein